MGKEFTVLVEKWVEQFNIGLGLSIKDDRIKQRKNDPPPPLSALTLLLPERTHHKLDFYGQSLCEILG